NDGGSQVLKLGESVRALARGEPLPEDGYRGEYVRELAELIDTDGMDAAAVGRAAVELIVAQMRRSLEAFAVAGFDRWEYESALGGDPDRLELLIMQLVHLIRAGERAQMSKRAGEFVTLDDLLAEIGVDAARWYLLARSHDTTVDLDLDLAREQSSENPVYYVQYAHARIASILAKAGSDRVREALAAPAGSPAARLHAAERELIERLIAFPAELAEAAT